MIAEAVRWFVIVVAAVAVLFVAAWWRWVAQPGPQLLFAWFGARVAGVRPGAIVATIARVIARFVAAVTVAVFALINPPLVAAIAVVWATTTALWTMRGVDWNRDGWWVAMLRRRVGRRDRHVMLEAGARVKRDGGRHDTPTLSRPKIIRDRGVTWRVELPAGVSVDLVRDTTDNIASAADALIGVRCELAEITPEPRRASRARLTLWVDDPLRVALPWPGWPHEPAHAYEAVTLRDGVPLGARRDGSTYCAPLLESNWLVGGQPGYGKTMISRARRLWLCALADAGVLPAVAFAHLDFKRVELPHTAASSTFQTFDVDDAGRFLERAVAELRRRMEWCADRSITKLEPEHLTDAMPLVAITIDEAHNLVAIPKARGKHDQAVDMAHRRRENLTTLLREARSFAMPIEFITQKPTVDVIGSEIRDLFSFAATTKTQTREHTTVVLGASTSSDAPHQLPAADDNRGITFALAEEGDLARFKSWWVDDETYRAGDRRAAEIIARPDWMTAPTRPRRTRGNNQGDNRGNRNNRDTEQRDERDGLELVQGVAAGAGG